MQRWLRRITPDRAWVQRHWILKPFTAIVDRAQCWNFHRSSVTRAFALGLFIAFIPAPVHLILCAILGVWLRLNLPVLFATVFVSNPFTWVPQAAGSVWVGAKLMGKDFMPLMQQMRQHDMSYVVHHLAAPLFLGALVLGTLTAAVGYVIAQCLWRARVVFHLRRRRARSEARRRALLQNPVD